MRIARTRIAALSMAAAVALVAAGCSSGESDTEGTRSVDIQGTAYSVPADPQRIIAIHNADTQALIEAGAGARLIAAQKMKPSAIPPAYRGAFDAIPNKIDMKDPAEKLAGFTPDLFVSVDVAEPGVNDELAKSAPVAIMQISGKQRTNWEGRSRAAAAILGNEGAVDGLAAKLAERQAQIKRDYADVLSTKTLTVLDSYERGNMYAYGTKSMVGDVFSKAGVRFAPSVTGGGTSPDKRPGEFTESSEQIGKYLDADIVMIGSDFDLKYSELQKSLVDNPLVVGANKIVQPMGLLTISSYAQAQFMLDSLEKALTAARDKK